MPIPFTDEETEAQWGTSVSPHKRSWSVLVQGSTPQLLQLSQIPTLSPSYCVTSLVSVFISKMRMIIAVTWRVAVRLRRDGPMCEVLRTVPSLCSPYT
jgi:hypothetical protein